MSTLRAILLHMGLAAAQAGITQVTTLQSPIAQLSGQVALLYMQALVAKKNSETDTKGNAIAVVSGSIAKGASAN